MYHENTLPNIKFNGIEIKTRGNGSDPLFLASDIICKVLNHRTLLDCKFYKKHEKDTELFVAVQEDSNEIYTTEFGLYRCLFASKEKIAVDFENHVMELLKGIRLGYIELEIKRPCQFEETLQQHPGSVMGELICSNILRKQTVELYTDYESLSNRRKINNLSDSEEKEYQQFRMDAYVDFIERKGVRIDMNSNIGCDVEVPENWEPDLSDEDLLDDY